MSASKITTDPMLRRSKDSAAMLDYWDQTDAIIDGVRGMRQGGEKYLPKFPDEDKDDYAYRLSVTKMTNVYRDIVESLAAKPFEQETKLIEDEDDKRAIPEQLLKLCEDIDGSGNSLTVFSGLTFFNGVNSAIDWIFVDFSDIQKSKVITIADAKAAGVRPFWSHVLGRNVLEARSEVTGGSERITYIRVYEPGKPDHVRVYERNDKTGVITWTLYEWRETTRKMDDGETHFHEIRSETLGIDTIPYVPFATGRRDGRSFRFFPAMADAADLQVELYQQESGLKFKKQLTAYAMLSGDGVKPQMMADGKTPLKLGIGPSRVLYGGVDAAGNVGSWKWIEPSATTLKFLADDIKDTITNLREIGRQPLTAQSAQLTVITTQVAAGKAKSAVGAWAINLNNALENAFVITCKWLNITPEQYDPVVRVFTEFDDFLDGKDLEDLNTMRENRDLSQETYWAEKKRRGVLSPDFNPDTERSLLLKETPGDPYDEPSEDKPNPANDPDGGKLPSVG